MKLFEIKNQTPKWLLTESKNTHLEHLEDLVFNNGYAGAQEALNFVDSLRSMLADGAGSATKLTVKWDGSPAIICGIDPEDAKFFVGTKAVFSKGNPRRCKSMGDVIEYYPEQPELQEILKAALKYLSKLNIRGVVQGDLMFTPGTVTTEDVGGESCYVFTPNTITYAVPVNSTIGQRIAKAKIGIIFHTNYTGETIDTMTADFGVNVSSFTQVNDVWFDDATYKDYTGVASLTPEENAKIQNYLSAAVNTMTKIGPQRFDIVLGDKEFSRMVKPFVNKLIRAGNYAVEPTKFLSDFLQHFEAEMMKGIEDLSGGIEGKPAQARIAKIKDKEQWIADNSNTLTGVLATYKRIIELKHMILQKLAQVEGIGTFQKTNDGYKVTAPEGFVAIGHDGDAVKLVDRLTFSRTNFLSKA
jgi:hypothetical protein